MSLRVRTVTVLPRFDVAGSNCLSCEHKREVFGKYRGKERGRVQRKNRVEWGQYGGYQRNKKSL